MRGEQRVGAILDALHRDGWRVIHGASLGRGDVDHIAIGPPGIFTVETKSHGGRIAVDRLDDRWLRQAYAQRKAIERVTGMPVESLLVFSRAFLSRGKSRQRGVLVMTSRFLAQHLRSQPRTLSDEQVRSVHARLAAALGD